MIDPFALEYQIPACLDLPQKKNCNKGSMTRNLFNKKT